MNYLIQEEELNKLEYIVKASNHPKIDLSDWLKSFKPKQPVEILAEGEFSDDWIIENDKLVMGSDITRKIYDLGFEGKQIQVLLAEVSK